MVDSQCVFFVTMLWLSEWIRQLRTWIKMSVYPKFLAHSFDSERWYFWFMGKYLQWCTDAFLAILWDKRSPVDWIFRLFRSMPCCSETAVLIILFLFSLFSPPFSNVTFFSRELAVNSEKGSHRQLYIQINRFVLIHWVMGDTSSNKALLLRSCRLT